MSEDLQTVTITLVILSAVLIQFTLVTLYPLKVCPANTTVTVYVDGELLEDTDCKLEILLNNMDTIDTNGDMQHIQTEVIEHILQLDDNALKSLAEEAVKALDALSEDTLNRLDAQNGNTAPASDRDNMTTDL